MTQLALFEPVARELVPRAPGCTWRGCSEPATVSLGFGRFKRELLFVDYCDEHAGDVERIFRVEARADVHSARAPRNTQNDLAGTRTRARRNRSRCSELHTK